MLKFKTFMFKINSFYSTHNGNCECCNELPRKCNKLLIGNDNQFLNSDVVSLELNLLFNYRTGCSINSFQLHILNMWFE